MLSGSTPSVSSYLYLRRDTTVLYHGKVSLHPLRVKG